MARIKRETHQKQRKYAPGTILAVDLYDNGNYFEAEVKRYGADKQNKDEAFVQYLDDKDTNSWIDFKVTRVVELAKNNVLTQEECVDGEVADDEKGHIGRRLTVSWLDDARYSGTITKVMKDNKNFVFISYDHGDRCWYNLLPECEEPSVVEAEESAAKKNSSKHKSKSSNKIKNEEKSSSDQKASEYEAKRKELEKKYPIGSLISVDIYHDEHYHEAYVKKYLAISNKKQQAKGEQWVSIQFLDKAKTKQWIDLSCIKVIKMTEENTLRLSEMKPGNERGFLGKRIVVVWPDGNKYRGLATRSAKDNKHFVFLEYDDGDECWCDLERESEWSIDDEASSGSDGSDGSDKNEEGDSSDESLDAPKSRTRVKRRGNVGSAGQSTKKARSTVEESYDF